MVGQSQGTERVAMRFTVSGEGDVPQREVLSCQHKGKEEEEVEEMKLCEALNVVNVHQSSPPRFMCIPSILGTCTHPTVQVPFEFYIQLYISYTSIQHTCTVPGYITVPVPGTHHHYTGTATPPHIDTDTQKCT